MSIVAREWDLPKLTLNIDNATRPPKCALLKMNKMLLSGGKFIYREF